MIKFIILVLSFIVFCIYQNNSIVITQSVHNTPKILNHFDGFKIVHISVLHNEMFGDGQIDILNKVRNLAPDIIVVTGDMIDRRKYDLETAMIFISGAI